MKHVDIHGKLNKIEFYDKSCRICHLGRTPAIIIDVLSVRYTSVFISRGDLEL